MLEAMLRGTEKPIIRAVVGERTEVRMKSRVRRCIVSWQQRLVEVLVLEVWLWL